MRPRRYFHDHVTPSRPVVIRGWPKILTAAAVLAVALSAASLSEAVPARALIPPPDHLQPGQSLAKGQALYSQEYAGVELILQTDGNLVAYVAASSRVLWASNSRGSGAVLRLQTDGNVVIYNAANHAVWNTGTYGSRAATWFGPEPDGNVSARNASAAAVWQSSTAVVSPSSFIVGHLTASSGLYSAVMQSDGNFVVYSFRSHTHAIWASGTTGHPGALLVKQSDGNLVIYQGTRALWATRTVVGPTADLEMQDDGNLVIYAKIHSIWKPVWATNTAGRQ